MGSDNGYGFIIKFDDFLTNYKNGKAIVTLKENHELLNPEAVIDLEKDSIAAITSKGRLLIFKLRQLPNLKKAKEIKLFPSPKKN